MTKETSGNTLAGICVEAAEAADTQLVMFLQPN
jgi:hypothetical protein